MNQFGGKWTEAKIEILVEYAKAYLTIMNKFADRYNWKLLYFDGFAGSGQITKGKGDNKRVIVGAAKRILEINEPRPFDQYYFVEKEIQNANELKEAVSQFKDKKTYVVNTDCNEKISSMSKFLKSKDGRSHKVLAYIDPCGMQLNWTSLKTLSESQVDAWILVPTGMGVNRLLKLNGDISDAWIEKLENFLGLGKEEILNYFYSQKVVTTLFGDEIKTTKEERAIEKSAELYQSRLSELFEYVSNPYVLKNKTNSIMFHFYMVSHNGTAAKIANQIIKKYNESA